ncbi:hypothetical protein J6R97_06595 [bacterium]|nr:hypothetical protein [bacterium]
MMNKKQQIEKRIQQIELQLKKLSQSSSGAEIEECLLNSLIMQKAVLKQELKDLSKKPVLEMLKKIVPRKEKLICDYFN